jgi:hypothetical protein
VTREHDGRAFDHHEPRDLAGDASVDELDVAGAGLPHRCRVVLELGGLRPSPDRAAERAHQRCVIRHRVAGRVAVDPRVVIAVAFGKELCDGAVRVIHRRMIPRLTSNVCSLL